MTSLNLKTSWRTKKLTATLMVGFFVFFGIESSLAQTTATIALNPNTKYQTIVGWEATDFVGLEISLALPNYKNALYDHVVNDVGINRIRLEIYPAVEHPTDYYGQYLNGQITKFDWVHTYGYSPVNDNSDPNNINLNGFKFSSLDWPVDNIVLPLKQRLEARGEKLFINLCFVHFGASSSGFYQYNNSQEYAEFMLATFQHMQQKYGFVPDAIEIELEPENTVSFSGAKMGYALQATAAKLQANGFSPKYVIPSTTQMCQAPWYFNDIKNVIGDAAVRQYVQELSYHRYSCVTDADLQLIVNTANSYGIGTSMLEWWDPGNTYATLHEDLKVGRNSAWQPTTVLDLYTLDATDPNNPILTMRWQTKWQRHILEYVRAGAVRIEVTSNNTNLDPLAFINKDGTYVVVVWNKTWGGRSFTISGLPAGTYGIKYIQGDTYNNNIQADTTKPDVTITAGQSISQSLTEQGVMTIFGKISALKGDLNTDTKVDVLDVQACVNHILGIQDWGAAADVNRDGAVNVLDVQVIVNTILGVGG